MPGIAFLTLVAFFALSTVGTIGTVFADDLSKVYGFAVGIGEDQLAGGVDRCFGNADTVFAVLAVDTVFSVFSVLSCVAFFALGTVGTVFADNLAEVYGFAVGIGEDQLAGGID